MKNKIILATLILVVAYLLGPQPKTPAYPATLPEVTKTANELKLLIDQRNENSNIKAGNQSVLIWADSSQLPTEYALLYLHGYTASPVEGMPVFTGFAQRYGCNTYAPRLPHHGLDTANAMINYTAEGQWKSACEALSIAKSLGQKVIIMSTSTGGTLALKLAAEFPNEVHALINLSPNVRPKPWNAYLLNKPWGLQLARLTLGDEFRHVNKEDSIYKRFWYESYRIESLVQLQELVETTMKAETFKKITCPTLNLCYYKNKKKQDEVVSVDRMIWMHSLLSTPEELKVFVPIPNAETHVIGSGIYSQAIDDVNAAIDLFVQNKLRLKPITLAP